MTPRTIDLVGGPDKFQEELEDLIRLSMPLERRYPLVLQFLGDPWDYEVYVWEEPLWNGTPRGDIIHCCWTKCRLEVAHRKDTPQDQVYNGELVKTYGEPAQLRVTLFTET
jgi:hypothetical protein